MPFEAIKDYWKTVGEIHNQGLPNITIVDNTVYESGLFPSWTHLAAALILWPLIYFFLRKNKSEDPLSFSLKPLPTVLLDLYRAWSSLSQ